MAKQLTKAQRKQKAERRVSKGRVYITSSFNNTIVSFTDENGGVVSWATAGSQGFKGARKATPYAAQVAAQAAAQKAKDKGMMEIEIFVSGVGPGREQAVRSLGSTGITITSIKDITPIPHGGVRAKKPRRV